jgi:hypothetical protein
MPDRQAESLTHGESVSHSAHPRAHTRARCQLHACSLTPLARALTQSRARRTWRYIWSVPKETPEDHTSHGSVLQADTAHLVCGGKFAVGIASLPSVPVHCVSYRGWLYIFSFMGCCACGNFSRVIAFLLSDVSYCETRCNCVLTLPMNCSARCILCAPYKH